MSTPMKPWEAANYGNRVLQSSSSQMPNVLTTPIGRVTATPPIPPRPNSQNYNSGVGMYNMYNRGYGMGSMSGYGSYNYGGYGGYGGYGSYGNYGNYGYGGYGPHNNMYDPENRFIQLAEESTRPAFQSIESLVRAFGNVAMMLDSTFFAIMSSFRAVLGIAENFGRLRGMFGQVWSSFALFRFLSWCYRKLQIMIGLRKSTDFVGNSIWEEAAQGLSTTVPANPSGCSSWPVFAFLGIIISAPYLISRMMPTIEDVRDPSKWPTPGVKIRVMFPFTASSPQELTVVPGDIITLAPKEIQQKMNLGNNGWIFAISNKGSGIVPINHLRIKMQTPSQPTQSSQPPIIEPGSTINESDLVVEENN